MTDTRVPKFNGERKDWPAFKLRFRPWCRRRSLVLTPTGLAAMDADGKCELADYIMMSVHGNVARKLAVHKDDGAAMWGALCARYEQLTMAERSELQRELAEVMLATGMDIDRYIGDKLAILTQLSDSGTKYSEEDQVIELLRGLGSDYDSVREAMEQLDVPGRTLLKCETLLRIRHNVITQGLQVEAAYAAAADNGGSGGKRRKKKRNKGGSGGRSGSGSNSRGGNGGNGGRARGSGSGHGDTSGRGGAQRDGSRRCYGCGSSEHTIGHCPEVECYSCHRKGHMKNQCPNGHANAVAVVSERRGTPRPSHSPATAQPATPVRTSERDVSGRMEAVEEVALAGSHDRVPRDGLQVLQQHDGWLVDSGTSVSMTPCKELISDYMQTRGMVRVADSSEVPVEGRGVVSVECATLDGAVAVLKFTVLHVPDLEFNLLSTDSLVDNGHKVMLEAQPHILLAGGARVLLERWRPRTLLVPIQRTNVTAHALHERLGHANMRACLEVARAHDIHVTAKSKLGCEPCAVGKVRRRDVPKEARRTAVQPLEVVCIDSAGPFVMSLHRQRYALAYTDQFSGCTWLYLTRTKAALANTIERFVAEAGKPALLRCDNAPDLLAGAYNAAAVRLGIRRENTARNAPHQNAHVERALATLTADARTLLADTGLPRAYWALAMSNACHTRNVIKTSQLKHQQGIDVTSVCRVPDVHMLRRWGAKAIVHDPTAKRRNKLQARGLPMIYVGQRIGMLGWVFVNPSTNRLIHSRDATFFEDISGAVLLQNNEAAVCDDIGGDEFEWLVIPEHSTVRAPTPRPVTPARVPAPNPATPVQRPATPARDSAPTRRGTPAGAMTRARAAARAQRPATPSDAREPVEVPIIPIDDEDANDDGDVGAELGWFDFDQEILDNSPPVGSAENPVDVSAVFGECAYAEAPHNYRQAMAGTDAAKWTAAIEEELKNHEHYGTWEIVPADQARGRVLTCGWTFTSKLQQDGQALRHKARLFVRGCQQSGSQFDETSAPVTNIIMFRLMLHRALTKSLVARHIDIKAAYLNAPLTEDIYMRVPAGVNVDGDKFVCKLKRSLYGLRQSGANWYSMVMNTLKEFGYQQSEYDPCLFRLKRSGGSEATITVYVDDFIVVGDGSTIEQIEKKLSERFTIKATDLNVYLSQLVEKQRGTYVVTQSAYITAMLAAYGLRDANQARSPCMKNEGNNGRQNAIDAGDYRRVVGQLNWLQLTVRPDITFAVHKLSTRVSDPRPQDLAAAKRVLRYLNGTRDVGLCVRGGGQLIAYVDSDWATDVETRRSVSGFVIGFVNGRNFTPIVWRSKKQTCVAASTCEAEYIACHEVCRELGYIRGVLLELKWINDQPTFVYCDNHAAVVIANDSGKRTKFARYIDIRFHYARWCVRDGRVEFKDVSTRDNLADAFTKSLSHTRHIELAKQFMHGFMH